MRLNKSDLAQDSAILSQASLYFLLPLLHIMLLTMCCRLPLGNNKFSEMNLMKKSKLADPFEQARLESGIGKMDDQNDPVTMLLRLKDVRKTAHNWKVFQSGAKPGRIVVPSEVNIRDTRQIPFEVDPPEHGDYRKLVEPWFKRPLEADYQAALTKQINEIVDEALSLDDIEVVSDFSLRLQSRALTLLLNTPYNEADTWIGWGTHVFRSEGESLDGDKANILYDYIDEQIERASENPSDDLYSVYKRYSKRGDTALLRTTR